MKKLLSVLLAAIMIASVLTAAVPASAAKSGFVDVEDGRWSEAQIKYASEKGYMKGVGGGRFDPEGPMTRAMVVTVLWRRDGEPEAGGSPFSDVPAGEWYAEPVAWAESTGVVAGVGGGKFDPDGVITREQLAAILYRYCSFKDLDVSERGDISVFNDKSAIDSWATEAVGWAVGIGLIRGVTAKTVDPLGNATREQVAAILERFDKTDLVNLVDLFSPIVEAIADYSQQMLDETLAKREGDPEVDLFSWRYGMILMGLAEAGRWDYVKEYVDRWMEFGDVCEPCDCGLAGYAIIGLYEETGDEKYLPVIEDMKRMMEEWPTAAGGVVLYGEGDGEDVYVDGTGMATPFIARYAGTFGDENMIKLARDQVNGYIKNGVNRLTQRAFHGFQREGVFAGEDGWGRGTGWLMHAIGNVMCYCPDDETVGKSEKFIEKTMTYRLPDGMFPWSLSIRNGAPSDTSATGMIMWGVMKAKENGKFANVPLGEITRTAKATLSDVRENGAVYGSSGESGGWGWYNGSDRATFDENNGWGQGGTLCFLASYLNYLKNN
ncbi:MAG: S-layer homology domain-containing protein [Clostridia bacterium]|nr:S-layer homology domain-containing protein [Clostridia bacterium]